MRNVELEPRFCSLKLEHVPHGQDAVMKELSQIAAKGITSSCGNLRREAVQAIRRTRRGGHRSPARDHAKGSPSS
jgi:hypothetical protein